MERGEYVTLDFVGFGEDVMRQWVDAGIQICGLLSSSAHGRLAIAGLMSADLIRHVRASIAQEEKEPEA